jgi:hypothetical protein
MEEVVDLLVVGKKNYSTEWVFFSSLHFYSLLPPVTQLTMAKLPLPPELWYEFSAQWFLTACYFESCPPFPSTFLRLPHDRCCDSFGGCDGKILS